MVEEGEAITVTPVAELNPVDGDHVNPVAPDAVIATESPVQMAGLRGETEIAGGAIA